MQTSSDVKKQVAYDSEDFRNKFGIGKTKLHEELNAGRLKARKLGRKLIITHDAAMDWLSSMPERAINSGDAA